MHGQVLKWLNRIQYGELIQAKNNAPQKILGLHKVEQGVIISTYRPEAVCVKAMYHDKCVELEQYEQYGYFATYIADQSIDFYTLEIRYSDGTIVETADPYEFEPVISGLDTHLFSEGNHYDIYEKLGAHPMELNGVKGTYFAVWAPNARRVSIVGDFNLWDGRIYPMKLLERTGIYELFIPGVEEGSIYKYQILTRSEEILYKADPYGNMFELRPNTASVVTNLKNFCWSDQKWMKKRSLENRVESRRKPMSIYEVHIGSWKKHSDGTEDGFYNYREMAHELANYVIDMGYTHVELMGILEHPFDGSWGYQVTGYYAPTRRYGTPEDFMYFVNYMHKKGIYILLDWVPAHFPKDAHGLGRFDGYPLYEHPDSRRGEHPHWGTYIFNYGRHEVENFLLANALFWIEVFHIDGLRVDAVASMLYLDYGKNSGEWLPNDHGGKENTDVIHFIKHMNRIIEERNPGALLIAEESTAWAGVTAPVDMGGLGFVYKWNMGWMNDFLEYMKLDPYFRRYNHQRITFGMMYIYSENFVQVFSHDEVVHGKCSMISKMPGDNKDKFANLRIAYGFMYGHPGKKLLFMGQEFGQWREWSEKRELDWYLLKNKEHIAMQNFVRKLNHLYQEYSAFYYNDYDPVGFEWINCQDNERSIVSFIRRGKTKKQQLLFIFNFTPVERRKYQVGVPCRGTYTEILNSDAEEFGGEGLCNVVALSAQHIPCDNQEYQIEFDLPSLSMVVFEFKYVKSLKSTKSTEAK